MSITPKEGWMIDPDNSNGVVQISAINPATGAAYGAPTAVDGKIVNPAPPIAPTPAITMPAKSGDGAVSSADIANGAAKNTATNAAAGALTPPKVDINQMQSDFNKSSNDRLALSQGALKGSFDATLAASNQQYAGMFASLEAAHRNASQAGNALASQLNPYADSRISSATGGYLQTIDDKYAAQAANLTAQMNAAQAQLQANYYENYVKLVNDAQQSQEDFTVQMQKFGLDMYNSMKQASQFDASNKLQEKTLDASLKNTATDDFRSYLTTLSGSPELQADIATYQKTGKISAGLMPIVQKGEQAGLSSNEAISIFQYQSDSVRKQQQLEDYRAQQLQISSDRVSIAQANYYNKLSSQTPSPGQIVNTSSNMPVKLTDTQSQFFSMGQHLDTQAQKVQTMLNALPTGAVKGWVTEEGKFVPVVQNKNDPKQYALLQAMADLNNMFIYFSTGKQLNESEFDRISNQLPNIKATPDYNKSALTQFTSSIQERMDSYLKVNGWSVYGTSNNVPSPTNTGASSDLKTKYPGLVGLP